MTSFLQEQTQEIIGSEVSAFGLSPQGTTGALRPFGSTPLSQPNKKASRKGRLYHHGAPVRVVVEPHWTTKPRRMGLGNTILS